MDAQVASAVFNSKVSVLNNLYSIINSPSGKTLKNKIFMKDLISMFSENFTLKSKSMTQIKYNFVLLNLKNNF